MKTLDQLGDPAIRIGGNSQDATAPVGFAVNSNWGISFRVEPAFWQRLACLTRSTHQQITVGINARIGDPQWAQTIARDAAAALPEQTLTFSLGNEPDLYGYANRSAWLSGNTLIRQVMPQAEFIRRSLVLKQAVLSGVAASGGAARSIIFSGPDFARTNSLPQLPIIIRQVGLGRVGLHAYALSRCHSHPTVQQLLSPRSAHAPTKLLHQIRLVHRIKRMRVILSESNSVSCSGQVGVSNTAAAGVWSARWLTNAVFDGFAQVYFHFSNSSYDPLLLRNGALASQPQYAGVLAAQSWLTSAKITRRQQRGALTIYRLEQRGRTSFLFDNSSPGTHIVRRPSAATTRFEQLRSDHIGLIRGSSTSGKLSLPSQSITMIGVA